MIDDNSQPPPAPPKRKPGRPPLMGGSRSLHTTLPLEVQQFYIELGGGSFPAGARLLRELYEGFPPAFLRELWRNKEFVRELMRRAPAA